MPPQLAAQGVSIVIRGTFNPAVFHPSWLSARGLIRVQEADAAEIELILPQVAKFSVEWLQFVASTDRLQVSTTQEPYYEPLRDLVVGILTIVKYTPLTLLGINRDFHYTLASDSAWHQVGHELVPKLHWEEVLDHPGMKVVVVQGRRPDDLKGYIRAKVEPSARFPQTVYVSVNDHYELSSTSQTPASADEAATILSDHWTDSMDRGKRIAQKIVSLGGTHD